MLLFVILLNCIYKYSKETPSYEDKYYTSESLKSLEAQLEVLDVNSEEDERMGSVCEAEPEEA